MFHRPQQSDDFVFGARGQIQLEHRGYAGRQCCDGLGGVRKHVLILAPPTDKKLSETVGAHGFAGSLQLHPHPGDENNTNKVVILGRGGAGQSVLAARLGSAVHLPVVELDEHFWPDDLTPISKDRWTAIQRRLIHAKGWILDGDLGPYDVLDVRLAHADTVVILDFPLWRCAARAIRRSCENFAFWRWVVCYRRRSLPAILAAIAAHASAADIYLLHGPREVNDFMRHASASGDTNSGDTNEESS